jgi:hypothetical protein
MQSEDLSKAPACERCHRRKTRCDKAQPTCSSCAKGGLLCAYSIRGPILRRQDVEALERQVQQLDAQNKRLMNSLRAAHNQTPVGSSSSPGNLSANDGTSRISNDRPCPTNDSEVANEVSSLSLHAGGYRQFLGSASGMLLGQLLQVEVHSIGQSRRNEASQMSASADTPACGDNVSPVTSDISPLPSEKLARSLLSAYLSHDHLCYPFLHPKSLTEKLDAIYEDASFYGNNPVEAFTFDMIFAIGTAQVYKYDCLWSSLVAKSVHYK